MRWRLPWLESEYKKEIQILESDCEMGILGNQEWGCYTVWQAHDYLHSANIAIYCCKILWMAHNNNKNIKNNMFDRKSNVTKNQTIFMHSLKMTKSVSHF